MIKIPKYKGDVNELKCMTSFIELGFQCAIPYGDRARYDFIAELAGNFYRIQCKSAQYTDESKTAFSVNCKSVTTKDGKRVIANYDKSQIDFIATFINNHLYIIPIETLSVKEYLVLRIRPNLKFIESLHHNATDYEAMTVFKNLGLPINNEDDIQFLDSEKSVHISHKSGICPICGGPSWRMGHLCLQCTKKGRSQHIPEKEVLKNLLKQKSLPKTAEYFKTSETTVRRWCLRYNLPTNTFKIRKLSDEEWDKL